MADTKSIRFSNETEEIILSDQESENEHLSRGFNKFLLLDGSGDELEADAVKSASEDEDSSSSAPKTSATKSLGKKKNHRKRRSKAKNRKHAGKIEDDLELLNLEQSGEDASKDLDLAVSEADKPTLVSNVDPTRYQLLKLDMRNLIADNEVKKMFGKSVLREERSKDRARHTGLSSISNVQRSRFVSSGVHDLRHAYPTSSPKMDLDPLFNDKQTTTTSTSDAKKKSSVNQVNFNDEPVYFKFVHDRAYQIIHENFLEAAQHGQSDRIVQLLHRHPTHVESLLQLSDMIRLSEDYKVAGDLVERALLVFERGFHPRFNMATATCRLSYKRPENRTFFITIFKHISYCNRRGLRRTPLEYSKLLLSLGPENDPLFASLLIDFYAIRSEEYDFLIEFVQRWKHLGDMPNMRFSLAMAHFLRAKKLKSTEELQQADDLLQRALILYPNFITKFLDVCSAEPNSDLKKCDYFDYSIFGQRYKTVPEPIELLISVYVHRNLALWKAKHVMAWFEKNVAVMVECFATGELTDKGENKRLWDIFKGPSPRSLLRHIVLSDLPVKVPPSASRSSILDIDPYPPQSIVSYTIDTNRLSGSSGVGLPSLFLRSFLPSFGQAQQPTADHPVMNSASQLSSSSGALSDQMAQALDDQLVLEQQLLQDPQIETTTGLDGLQGSIRHVLVSLADLLSGTHDRQESNHDDSAQHNGNHEHQD